MNSYERFALNEYLSEIPEGLNYTEIINLLKEGNETIVPCELYDGVYLNEIAELIESTKDHAMLIFNPKDIHEQT